VLAVACYREGRLVWRLGAGGELSEPVKFAVFTDDEGNPIAVKPDDVTCITIDDGKEDEDGNLIENPQAWTLIHFAAEFYVSVVNEFPEVIEKLQATSRME
jgi:hypothetical protein